MERAMKGKSRPLFLAVCVMLAAGCATTQETSTLQQNVNNLYQQMKSMESRLEKLERQVQGGGGDGGGTAMSLADMYARMEEMQVKIGRLGGQIESQERELESLKSMSAPVMSEAPDQTQQAAPNILIPESTPQQGTTDAQAPPSVAAAPKSVDPEKAQYDKALQLYQQRQYDKARAEFQDFAAKYPASGLADNALFWIGEGYYSQKRYREAIEAYQQILERYPKGNKAPSALLKQGDAFEQLKDATAARILYDRLVEEYPDSPQASIAQNKLKSMP